MKDFYDVAVLARDFDFDGEVLTRAIRATFERRKTMLPTATPVALTDAFAEDLTKMTQWSGFVRKANVRDAGSLRRGPQRAEAGQLWVAREPRSLAYPGGGEIPIDSAANDATGTRTER